MLKALVDFVFMLVQMGQVQMLSFKSSIWRFAQGLMLQLLGLGVAVFGVIMLLWSVYWALTTALGVAIGALLTGVAALILASLICAIGWFRSR